MTQKELFGLNLRDTHNTHTETTDINDNGETSRAVEGGRGQRLETIFFFGIIRTHTEE